MTARRSADAGSTEGTRDMTRILQALLVCAAFAATQAQAQTIPKGFKRDDSCRRMTTSLNSGQSLGSYTCKWKYGCTCTYVTCPPPRYNVGKLSCLTAPG
jgi:hypothetical protein